MLLIADAPTNQRWLMRGSNTFSRGGIWGLAQVEGLSQTLVLAQGVAKASISA